MKHFFKGYPILAFLIGVLLAGGFVAHGMTAGYNPIIKSSNTHYDAQIVNQSTTAKGYPLYTDGPYYTSRSTKTPADNGSRYNNDYVRVMQTKTTKTGTYAQLRYFSKTIGWMNVHGIKSASLSQVAKGTMQQNNAIGTAVLAPAGGSKTVVVTNGYANADKKVANASDGSVLYPLASLQKSMTAAMIQQLISAGKLSASTTLDKYYPKVDHSDDITIKQMLSMTSGLDNVDITPSKAMTENQAYDSMVQRARSTGDNDFDYSDANYVLLAGIISKVTGQSYAQNLQSRILDKLGMTNTVIVGSKAPNTKATLALGYDAKGSQNYLNPYGISLARLSAIPGAGNLLTTPTDYAKFVLGLQNGAILTAKQYQQMTSYGSVYSGGLYVTRSGIKYNNGSFGGADFHTGYYATTGNYHMALVFTNQTPLTNNLAPKKFMELMYQVAKYY